MNNYIVKTIFSKKECDKILEMKTKMVRRQELVPEFEQKKSTFLNNNFKPNILTTEEGSGEHIDKIIRKDIESLGFIIWGFELVGNSNKRILSPFSGTTSG